LLAGDPVLVGERRGECLLGVADFSAAQHAIIVEVGDLELV
jgi:hypothetical protein